MGTVPHISIARQRTILRIVNHFVSSLGYTEQDLPICLSISPTMKALQSMLLPKAKALLRDEDKSLYRARQVFRERKAAPGLLSGR